jgi:hypothetical protein
MARTSGKMPEDRTAYMIYQYSRTLDDFREAKQKDGRNSFCACK